jgi:hypothetical protein
MSQEPGRTEKRGLETYNTVAETVGLVPSVRLKDNVIQGITVLVVTGVAALAGFLMKGIQGLAFGTLLGLVGSLLLSGGVLMVVGWIRAAKKLS